MMITLRVRGAGWQGSLAGWSFGECTRGRRRKDGGERRSGKRNARSPDSWFPSSVILEERKPSRTAQGRGGDTAQTASHTRGHQQIEKGGPGERAGDTRNSRMHPGTRRIQWCGSVGSAGRRPSGARQGRTPQVRCALQLGPRGERRCGPVGRVRVVLRRCAAHCSLARGGSVDVVRWGASADR